MSIITSLESHLNNIFLTSFSDSYNRQEIINEHIKWLEDKIKSITDWSYSVRAYHMSSSVSILEEDHPKLFKDGRIPHSIRNILENQVIEFGKVHSMTIFLGDYINNYLSISKRYFTWHITYKQRK